MVDIHRGGERRFDRRTLVALSGAVAAAAVGESASLSGLVKPRAPGSCPDTI
jgi:hypothetical protein